MVIFTVNSVLLKIEKNIYFFSFSSFIMSMLYFNNLLYTFFMKKISQMKIPKLMY